MAKGLNIFGAQIPALTSAEVVTWKASGLLDGDAVIDYEAYLLIFYNLDTDTFTEIPFGGAGGSYASQHLLHSGALIDTNLIGLTAVTGVFVDGAMIPWVLDSTPDPGYSVNIDTTTGEVDPGYTWDSNNVIIQYTSTIPPSV